MTHKCSCLNAKGLSKNWWFIWYENVKWYSSIYCQLGDYMTPIQEPEMSGAQTFVSSAVSWQQDVWHVTTSFPKQRSCRMPQFMKQLQSLQNILFRQPQVDRSQFEDGQETYHRRVTCWKQGWWCAKRFAQCLSVLCEHSEWPSKSSPCQGYQWWEFEISLITSTKILSQNPRVPLANFPRLANFPSDGFPIMVIFDDFWGQCGSTSVWRWNLLHENW